MTQNCRIVAIGEVLWDLFDNSTVLPGSDATPSVVLVQASPPDRVP